MSLTWAFPKRGRIIVGIVLFLPVAVVLGSNPFCLSSKEQNALFRSQVFGFKQPINPEFFAKEEYRMTHQKLKHLQNMAPLNDQLVPQP